MADSCGPTPKLKGEHMDPSKMQKVTVKDIRDARYGEIFIIRET